jgi:hypothetical protein
MLTAWLSLVKLMMDLGLRPALALRDPPATQINVYSLTNVTKAESSHLIAPSMIALALASPRQHVPEASANGTLCQFPAEIGTLLEVKRTSGKAVGCVGPAIDRCMVRRALQEEFCKLADVRSCINMSGL